MVGDLVKVCLLGPAKLGNRWLKTGDEPEVTAEEKIALELAGLIQASDPDTAIEGGATRTFTAAEWLAIETRLLELGQSLERVELRAGDLTARTEQLQGELDAALLGLEQVTAERDHLIQQVAALQEQLAAGANTKPSPDGQSGEETTGTDTAQPQSGAAPADQNTPPTETAAKTAQKKGAAANTKA